MVYKGYLSFAGTEIANSARLAAYVRHQLPTFPLEEKVVVSCENLPAILGDAEYESPLVDKAPWLDESDPGSYRFYGLHILDMQGFSDSTAETSVEESLLNGATFGATRHASRQMRVKALMIGETGLALESGMTWLRNALAATDCGGAGCLGGALCYFADCPDVCPDAVDESQPVDTITAFGSLSPSTSPLIHRFPSRLGPASATWNLAPTEGAIVQYGAMSLTDQTRLSTSDPITLQRTNYFPDPTVSRKSTWTLSGPGGFTIEQADGRRVDSYGRVTVPGEVVTNWFPNSSFEDEPISAGWAGNGDGGIRHVLDQSPTAGQYVGEVTPSVASTELWATGPILGPEIPVPQSIQIYVQKTPDRVTLQMLNPEGNVVESYEIPPLTAEWTRVIVKMTAGAGYTMRLYVGTPTAPLRFDSAMASDYLPDTTDSFYFDGDTADIPPVVEYFWLDGTRASASRYTVTLSPFEATTLTSGPIDGVAGVNTQSIRLRALGRSVVTVKVLASDGSIIANQVLSVEPDWETYSIQIPYATDVSIVLSAYRAFDFDQLSVEPGPALRPFFDPDAVTPGYETTWLGDPDVSPLRIRYVGEMTTSRRDSDWRPYVVSLTGVVPTVEIETRQFARSDLDACVDIYRRTFHEVQVTDGPRVTKEFRPVGGGVMQTIEFILTAGHPFPYGKTRELFSGVAGEVPATNFVDPVVPPAPVIVIVDPDCPPLPVPPQAPVILDSCVDNDITNWQRYRIPVSGDVVPEWAVGVPTIKLQSGASAYRQVRVRFHPNPFGWDPEDVDPLSFCSEFIVSYLPPHTELIVDGTVSRATAAVGGADPIPANNLLYGTDGVPISWPALSCGVPYLVTVDVPAPGANALGIDLALTRRE